MGEIALLAEPVVAGSLLGLKQTGSGSYSNIGRQFFGYDPNVFPNPSTDYGWLGRFELPIPNGSTITGVSVSMYRADVANDPVVSMTAGLLAPDGVWETGTFSTADYPTLGDLPWPEYNAGTLASARWLGGSPAFSGQSFTTPANVGEAFSWGEGITTANAVTGVIAKLQTFLDTYGSSLRGGSVSGTDLPVAVCFYRAWTGVGSANGIGVYGSGYPLYALHPTLTVAWAPPNSGPVKGSIGVESAVSSRVDSKPIISGAIEMEPAVSGRMRLR